MRRSAAATLMAVVVVVAACDSGSTTSQSAEPTNGTTQSSPSTPIGTPVSAAPSSPPIASPTPLPRVPTLASGLALPACVPAAPGASDNVTFVASGYAWALSPSGSHLSCLFAVADAGPFQWGPLGDRALLGGLEVKGVAGGPSVGASNQTFATFTWSRPTGKAIVYAPAAGTSLQKLSIDGTPIQDVTPLSLSRYLSVTYHPSGEAFAFVVERAGVQSIWMSSNRGKKPGRLVFTEEGTRFGAMGFEVDGKHLLYAAQHPDNHAELHRIDVTDPTQAPVVWDGPVGPMVMDIQPGLQTGTLAWTTGRSCADSAAMAQTSTGTVRALPGATGPTRAVGWLGPTQLLIASGGCSGPLDLSAVDVSTGSIVPLVSGVSAAAVRTPVPTPPAPLPKSIPTEGSGFG